MNNQRRKEIQEVLNELAHFSMAQSPPLTRLSQPLTKQRSSQAHASRAGHPPIHSLRRANMRNLYCVIYKPTGEVCEVEGGICYDAHRSAESAQASIDIMGSRFAQNYEVGVLPRHLSPPKRSAYESKAFRRTLRRLRRGVSMHTHGKTSPAKSATFRLETNGQKYRGIVSVDGYGIIELWEHATLDVVRRIACGYYPSLCKHFGPARQFAGV